MLGKLTVGFFVGCGFATMICLGILVDARYFVALVFFAPFVLWGIVALVYEAWNDEEESHDPNA